ncbi:MAG: universal stress protein [Chloroflexi bacterium]|nr:universal stress protein [Chloroflexota bacterium]
MYGNILVGLDGSYWSEQAMGAALALAEGEGQARLIGCHVYAAQMHRARFEQMEPGLPERYHDEERMQGLRNTHDSLISEGMKLISNAYLAPLERRAKEKGISCIGLTPHGRNYVELLQALRREVADLLVMGAWGHGRVPESQLGSVVERVLLHARDCDVLVVKRPWAMKDRPIVVGIDGSPDSYAALQRAVELSRQFGATVEAVAAYDPFFHAGVFRATAEALSDEAAQRFNFPAQERLHDEIIDRGLEKLYRDGLEQAVLLARRQGVEVRTEVLAGKVYSKLHHYAALRESALTVVGRWGLHREAESLIGSNALALARLSTTANVLVVAPPAAPPQMPESPPSHAEPEPEARSETEQSGLSWTPDAEERLKRVPFFVRRMARGAIEKYARQRGITQVTAAVVGEVAARFGMGR